jgi:ATP-binding cassette, subfamily B (MDR/TAP), member 1
VSIANFLPAAIVLSQVAPLLPLFGGAVAAFGRLRDDIDHQPIINGTSDTGLTPSSFEGGIQFRDVAFTYPSRPDHPVLKGVSFDCEPGKLTAIVGLSGSGKSTIASLIARFYDPADGAIFVDGHNLKDLNVKTLRGLISLVPQEPSLLDRSILENIALGLVNSPPHASLESTLKSGTLSRIAEEARNGRNLAQRAQEQGSEVSEIIQLVQKAVMLADADGFVDRLEHGLATLVGSSGSLISGGQKQRIALARALVSDPKVLVLDEATAALDSASEKRIQAAIEKATIGRTVISIAHRLSTIRSANKIVVMKTGEILEEGTHEELMNRQGSYADMIQLQTNKEEQPSEKKADIDEIPVEEEKQDSTNLASKEGADTVAPVEEAPKEAGEIVGYNVSRTMAPLLRPYLLFFVIAFIAALVVGGTYPASGVIFGNTLGSFSPCNAPDFVRSRGLLFSGLWFMLACVEFLANFTSWSVFGLISERLIFKVRTQSLYALLQQPLQWHESNGRSPTMLLEYITKDGNALAGFSGSIVGTLFSVIVNFVAAIILSHIIAWRIAIVCLVVVPLLLGSGFMQLRSISRFAEKHAGAFSLSIGITVEAVSNIRTVASLSLEDEIMETYRRSLEAPRNEMIVQSFKTNVWLAIANSTGNLLYAFTFWWGSKNILEGRYTQTQYFIILIAMLVSAQLWGQLFTLAPEISRAKTSITRVAGLIELADNSTDPSHRKGTPDSTEVAWEKGDIEALVEGPNTASISSRGATVQFRDVSFSYPARPNAQVLSSLSLRIKSGQFCALVGPSGAGKSTVLALLERFYVPSSGTITMNNFEISHALGTSFRDDIAYVPQENVLFQGSVKFNIALGARPGHTPSDEEIQKACKVANIHETIIGLPQGYDTECGTNGSQFSGGQRQRLSIARALVRKPKLLLLDESTSALDAESEKALASGLEKAVKDDGITVIAIAHRLSTIVKSDVIFLIDGGKVVDQGRHEELLERSESYRVNALHQILA